LPAEAHDTELTPAPPRLFSAAVPGTSIPACQVRLVSLATNAWWWSEPSV
jgi:hypothetical protein